MEWGDERKEKQSLRLGERSQENKRSAAYQMRGKMKRCYRVHVCVYECVLICVGVCEYKCTWLSFLCLCPGDEGWSVPLSSSSSPLPPGQEDTQGATPLNYKQNQRNMLSATVMHQSIISLDDDDSNSPTPENVKHWGHSGHIFKRFSVTVMLEIVLTYILHTY